MTDFDKHLKGSFHHAQTCSKIKYSGSPFKMKWGETGKPEKTICDAPLKVTIPIALAAFCLFIAFSYIACDGLNKARDLNYKQEIKEEVKND